MDFWNEKIRRPSQKCFSVVEQFDKLTVTPVETTAEYQSDICFDRLSIRFTTGFRDSFL